MSRTKYQEHFTMTTYPEPPQAFHHDMDLSPDHYGTYPAPPPESFPPPISYGAFYGDSPCMYNGRSSPMYADDDLRMPPSSNLSTASASSSTMGSPLSHPGQPAPIPDWAAPNGLNASPGIVDQNDCFPGADLAYPGNGEGFIDFPQPKSFVDPILIQPELISQPIITSYESGLQPSTQAYTASPVLSPSPQLRTGSSSPFLHNSSSSSNYTQFGNSPFTAPDSQRRQSLMSYHSNFSSGEQSYSGDESKEKQRCPHPECGKAFKDLRAHMLTHQTERPEKCPIQTCEYHTKGFARKYDKNRHTLTHYKGTMVCGFCPGSGSAAEKSFNRADVFKRHLTAVHGVEQTPPNARKRTSGSTDPKKLSGYPPDATGKCSTCSATFPNAQDFYEHLDDCVLRIVQQEDPAEAINAKALGEVENDRDVRNTLEKNHLPAATIDAKDEDKDVETPEEKAIEDENSCNILVKAERGGIKTSSTSPTKKTRGNPPNGVQKSRGLTHSRGGVPLGKTRNRKTRPDLPSSWGFDKAQMTMKKRVMAVFDGPRRLAKDDMMLSTEHEVRLPLSDGRSYVTDLDVQTLKRAEGFLGATDEEKGPWISDDPTEEELKKMLECSPEVTVA